MPTLGVTVSARAQPPSRGVAANTSTWFVAGEATTGSITAATKVLSVNDFALVYGARGVGNALLYDAVETFFAEGGAVAYVARVATAATIAEWTTALTLFLPAYGAGQVSTPGKFDVPTQAALWAHCAANNRFALGDVSDTSVVATLAAEGAAAPVLNTNYGAKFGPWGQIPGLNGSPTTRNVPMSPVIAGLCARVDALGNVNRAAAGRDFPMRYMLALNTEFSDADRDSLLNAGINTAKTVYGVLENYGFQTPASQANDPVYWQANCARLRMALLEFGKQVGEAYMFKPLDGKGLLQMSLASDLEAGLSGLYAANALYGDTPADAYRVDASASVNTPGTIAQGRLIAVVMFTPSLHAKSIELQLVSVPITV